MSDVLNDRFITKTALKERGWTDKLIRTLLREPDRLKGNRYRAGCPIQLFSGARVEKAERESSEEFRQAGKRGAGARRRQ
jgi:hypothetical protein